MVPPRWVRRVVLAPAVLLLTFLLVTSLPLAAIAAAFASRWFPGRWRPLRLLWFLLVYLLLESATLLALFGLWVASGFGRRGRRERWQAAHYAVMRWYLAVLLRTAERRFNLRFDLDLDEARRPERVTPPPPLLVFARHAGPGDSFLLVHGLLQLGYRPRIVLKGTLRWAPTIDVVLHRVPSFFVVRGAPRGTGTGAVAALAQGMGPGDALVLFPEGRNFTADRRHTSIAKLEELGEHEAAEEARELRHVLSPRTGGALAALEHAPAAEVAFVVHTGLEDLSGIVDLWRGLPMDAAIRIKAWRVPRDEIPIAREARVAWLAWWWRRIDGWLVERFGRTAAPDRVVEAVRGGHHPDVGDGHPAGLHGCFPELGAIPVEALQDGWDSEVTLLEGDLIVRIPQRPEVAETARAEARFLPVLASRLPLAVPEPVGTCELHGSIVYRRIPGAAATPEQLGSLDPTAARQLAAFLEALRTVDVAAAREAGVPDLGGEAWLAMYDDLCDRFAATVVPRLAEGERGVALRFLGSVVEQLEATGADATSTVVHADLCADHVRCGAEGLTGVIDWGDVRIGDPALDLAWPLHDTPAAFAGAVADELAVDDDTRRRAALYHRLTPWFGVEHGLATGDRDVLRTSLDEVRYRVVGSAEIA